MVAAILGRQAELGLAELESVFGANKVKPLGESAALVDLAVGADNLGSVIKLASPMREVDFTDWRKLQAFAVENLPKHLGANLSPGKLKLGLSVYGLNISTQQLFRSGLELKKACRQAGFSTRLVPATDHTLNSAQVLHNQLTGPRGLEIIFIKNGHKTWIGQTTWVQDVDDYSRRDFGRPKRDAFVGMLPPKLAQIMLNLAQVKPGEHVLDPFCGTGVVLQEAALRGCSIYGTDLEERMVRYSRDNLEWLQEIYGAKFDKFYEMADATTATWRPPLQHVVCETYLGQPLSGLPKPEKLAEIMSDCNTIISKFLKNIRPQLATASRHCIAVPAWMINGKFKHLPLLDHLEDLGYNRVRFQLAGQEKLIYHRHDQIVARELLILTVK